MRSHVTTHVLDTSRGAPAEGVQVRLEEAGATDGATATSVSGPSVIATGVTDADGRVGQLGPERLAEGVYRLVLATGDYFDGRGTESFYPEVVVVFRLVDAPDGQPQHFHVPVLLSPFAYSTYRGS
ncbi:hydroxyisourate hydrolase [Oerskovia flava]|uniref:hydroxyisourate hydrolase n=1 Tax=Oerskovia flava TaxID=2986422 RepID=UPI00223F04D9|nr:hydroxyisourate hydrolase [Oerskovia sp. JB1-3-2]